MEAGGAAAGDRDVRQRRGGPEAVRAGLGLLLVLAAVFPLIGGWAFRRTGTAGLLSAAVAFLVCLGSGSLALALAALARRGREGVSLLLGSVLVRTLVPLFAGILLKGAGGVLAAGEILLMVLLYYFVMLVTETWLSVRLIRRTTQPPVRL